MIKCAICDKTTKRAEIVIEKRFENKPVCKDCIHSGRLSDNWVRIQMKRDGEIDE